MKGGRDVGKEEREGIREEDRGRDGWRKLMKGWRREG